MENNCMNNFDYSLCTCLIRGVFEKYPEKVQNLLINANIRVKMSLVILWYSVHIIQKKKVKQNVLLHNPQSL